MESNSNQKEHKYFSELIGDSYKEWENTRIILEGGTGTGKTYFIMNILTFYTGSCSIVSYACISISFVTAYG